MAMGFGIARFGRGVYKPPLNLTIWVKKFFPRDLVWRQEEPQMHCHSRSLGTNFKMDMFSGFKRAITRPISDRKQFWFYPFNIADY